MQPIISCFLLIQLFLGGVAFDTHHFGLSETDNNVFENKSFFVDAADMSVSYPGEYEIEKSQEVNRRGSFVSYTFRKEHEFPYLHEILFYDEQSIAQFEESCPDDSICFFGGYPDMEQYQNQRKALANNMDYGMSQLQVFGEESYHVYSSRCYGDSCWYKEYTTYFDDVRIDISILMENKDQEQLADELFKSIQLF